MFLVMGRCSHFGNISLMTFLVIPQEAAAGFLVTNAFAAVVQHDGGLIVVSEGVKIVTGLFEDWG